MGPPTKVAYDADGQPTMAAIKFAEKVGVAVKALKTQDTEKGSYLCAKVTERGLATKTTKSHKNKNNVSNYSDREDMEDNIRHLKRY